ncbi:unnamed protein product, partial [Prorocentrum cordatum]
LAACARRWALSGPTARATMHYRLLVLCARVGCTPPRRTSSTTARPRASHLGGLGRYSPHPPLAGLWRLTPTPISAVCLRRGKKIPIPGMVVTFWLPGWPKRYHRHRNLGSSPPCGGSPLCWCWCPLPGLRAPPPSRAPPRPSYGGPLKGPAAPRAGLPTGPPPAPPLVEAQGPSSREPYGSTGVLEALSVAVQRRRPVFVCPVVDFAAFEGLQRAAASAAGDAPAPAPAGAAGAPGARAAQPGGGRSAPAPAAPLSTMVMLRPLSTVEEAFAALRHEQMLRGDFVRAELLLDDGGGGQRGAAAPAASPTRVLKREETCCGAEAAPPRRVRSCSGSSPTRRRLLASARPSASRRAWPSPPRG